MVTENLVAQSRGVEMKINFRGGNALVSEHHLNGSQIGTAFKEVCGE